MTSDASKAAAKPVKSPAVDGYIAEFPADIQKILKKVRSTARKAIPDASEKISYGMPTLYRKKNLFHFAAFKQHLGIYPGPAAIEAFQDRLEGYRCAKGTIQFPYKDSIDYDLIADIARWSAEHEG
ncbi:MAG: DUF1801 domain-containing protein [Clostridiales Family XIII bacterium]|nr:DUF1801 domain-containing protein [Clostridiales Family XIII bacterium]